jgi:hypothetical protein
MGIQASDSTAINVLISRVTPYFNGLLCKPYSEEYEQQMRAFYTSLSETDKRRYAALEARKLPYGGISYLYRVLGCDPKTIGRGLAELEGFEGASPGDSIRKAGGGRKRALETTEKIEVFDHDFSHLAEGVAIPHAIHDVQNNSAYINIGTSKETSEFACDSIRRW